ncbi:hypothetical protein V6Z12_D05G254400 [Gossypium hirsutum]
MSRWWAGGAGTTAAVGLFAAVFCFFCCSKICFFLCFCLFCFGLICFSLAMVDRETTVVVERRCTVVVAGG